MAESEPKDLRQYRLENWDWCAEYREKLGIEAYNTYTNRVFSLAEKLERGQSLKVRIWCKSPDNYDLFIKTLCYAVLLPSPGKVFAFSDDYELFRRII